MTDDEATGGHFNGLGFVVNKSDKEKIMGSLKKQALENKSEDIQTHELTEQEIVYLRLLNLTLQYHTLGQKIMSGFLYYISTNRLGYPHNTDLLFEIDLEKDDKMLTVKLLPVDATLDNKEEIV